MIGAKRTPGARHKSSAIKFIDESHNGARAALNDIYVHVSRTSLIFRYLKIVSAVSDCVCIISARSIANSTEIFTVS